MCMETVILLDRLISTYIFSLGIESIAVEVKKFLDLQSVCTFLARLQWLRRGELMVWPQLKVSSPAC